MRYPCFFNAVIALQYVCLSLFCSRSKLFPQGPNCVVYPSLEQALNFEPWSIIVHLNCQTVVKPFSDNAPIKHHAMAFE